MWLSWCDCILKARGCSERFSQVNSSQPRKSAHVWQALSDVLSSLHRMAAFVGDTTLHEAVGNGMLRDALQEVRMAAMG